MVALISLQEKVDCTPFGDVRRRKKRISHYKKGKEKLQKRSDRHNETCRRANGIIG